jgi:serine/threonine protein kinase/tetratricopeptide (TPR) repeat protein
MSEFAREQVDSILKRALGLSDRERERFLDETCDRDTDLRRAVDRMLHRCESGVPLLRPGGGAAGPLWEALTRDLAAAFQFEPGERLGAYRIVRMLGRGGMATVYLAERADGQFEQAVALKVLDVSRDFDALTARFAQERRILARLEHPNIARLIDGGSTRNGQPYVVMEWVDGEPIDRYCDNHRLDVEQRIRLFGDVASAVQYAHGHLVVHRDIKPSNILVTSASVPKLLDFGIAKLLEPDGAAPITRSAQHPMTPEYASPEQVRGELLTTASDVYQLGYLLYQLLTGRAPYDCDRRNVAAVVQAICGMEPARPSAVVKTACDAAAARSSTPERLSRILDGDLDTIVIRAMDKQPTRRYPSASHLRDDLRRHLEGLPVMARRDTLSYRAGKFVSRHRAGVAAVALAAAALSAGFGVALWQAQEKSREAARAEEITRFVLSLFEQADPSINQGEIMTVTALLEQGRARVERELRGQPATQADLYRVLGTVHHRLGAGAQALPMLERSLELRRGIFGPQHPSVAEVIADMGQVQNSLGNYAESIRLHREALAMRERTLGTDHEDVAASSIALGKALGDDGKFIEADRLLREALAVLRPTPDIEHPLAPEALVRLGVMLRMQGRHDEAEAHLREAVKLQRRLLGPDHSGYAQTLDSLAGLLRQQGDDAEAEAVSREVLAILERVYGPDHPAVATALTTLAGALHQQAKFDEAALHYGRALSIKRERFGNDNMRVAHAQLSLAATLQAKAEFAAAEASAREALAIFSKTVGDDHMWVAVSLQVLGANLYELDRLREAEQVLERAIGMTREIWNDEHPQYANVLFDYAKVLLAVGRLRDAEVAFRRTVDLRRAQYGERSLFVADPTAWLGRCLARDGRFAEAEPLLLESYPQLLAGVGPDYPETRAARDSLRAVYAALGEPDRAAAFE